MATIQITRGLVTQVDDEDFYWLDQWNWFVTGKGDELYVKRSKKKERY